jgi:hypothetical protein
VKGTNHFQCCGSILSPIEERLWIASEEGQRIPIMVRGKLKTEIGGAKRKWAPV